MQRSIRYLILTSLITFLFNSCTFLSPPPEGMRYYIVARTPSTEKQALEQARELGNKDYYSNVYRTRHEALLVTIGPYQSFDRAEASRLAAVGRKDIPTGSFVISEDKIANWKPGGGAPPTTPETPIASLACISKFYVVAASFDNPDAAIQEARRIKYYQTRYNTAVFFTEDNKYLVTIGYLEASDAKKRKSAAISSGLARSGSYLSNGKGFLENVYYSSEFGPDGLPFGGGRRL